MVNNIKGTMALISHCQLGRIRTYPKIRDPLVPRITMSSPWSGITSSPREFASRSLNKPTIPSAPEPPRAFPTSGYKSIEAGQLVEEEELPDYKEDRFYPVHLGEVFRDRYQAIAKLGFGTSSTTWLARDLRHAL